MDGGGPHLTNSLGFNAYSSLMGCIQNQSLKFAGGKWDPGIRNQDKENRD